MINQEVIVNQHLEEQVMLEHPDFPLGRFIDQLDYFVDGSFLCHWHTNFELASSRFRWRREWGSSSTPSPCTPPAS